MASSNRTAAPPVGEDITALKTELYEACVPFAKDNPKIVFHQADIFDLDIIPNNDVQILLKVSQLLLDEKLFKVVHNTDGMGWKIRTVDEAKKHVISFIISHSASLGVG
jgi:DNA-directed RNA polymerase III subunit RPC6